VIYAYIHCFYTELALYLVLHGASKNFTLSFMVQVKTIRCCILRGVYQMRVARP
jgi:hypothetical protein